MDQVAPRDIPIEGSPNLVMQIGVWRARLAWRDFVES